MRSGMRLVIDLSDVQCLTSPVLGKLINLKKKLSSHGVRVALRHVQPDHRMATRWLADRPSRWLWKLVEYAAVAIILSCLLALVGFLDFRRYHPPRDITTVDQLVASLPQTLKFALVNQGGTPYVVWIGRPRGVTVSGPPVYVFDGLGNIVDHVGDAGESDNKFVLELYVAAFHAPKATAEEAVTFCWQRRTGPP